MRLDRQRSDGARLATVVVMLLGYVVVATTLLSLGLMYFIQRAVAETQRR